MEPGAVGQPEVDVRRGVVEAPATCRSETLGQPAYGLLVGEGDAGPLEPGSPVDPDLVGTVDQDVGDPVEPEQGFERTGPDHVAVQRVVDGQHGGVAHGPPLVAQRLGDQLRRQRRRIASQPFAYAVQQLGRHLTHRRGSFSCRDHRTVRQQCGHARARGSGQRPPT